LGTTKARLITHPDVLQPELLVVESTDDWAELGCSLASLRDLAAMKLSAIGGWGARKDSIDIYALGRIGLSLPEMLAAFERKYHLDVGHVIMSLTYFDDAEGDDTPEMLWKISWEEIKGSIRKWVGELLPPEHAHSRGT
jgi:hypothetical protein